MKRPGAIDTAGRFAPLRSQLLSLLASLPEHGWSRPTAAPGWSVKDVAAHLLGGDIGILSRKRDQYRPPGSAITTHAELVHLVNRLNAEWVQAAARMSPRVLCELLEVTGPEVEAYFASLDPAALGEPVSWAGPDPAPVWLDLAREFTERWHHQQQVRDATGNPPLYDPFFLGPVLDAFVRALPHGFRRIAAPQGTSVRFEIAGSAGGVWFGPDGRGVGPRAGGGKQPRRERSPAPGRGMEDVHQRPAPGKGARGGHRGGRCGPCRTGLPNRSDHWLNGYWVRIVTRARTV